MISGFTVEEYHRRRIPAHPHHCADCVLVIEDAFLSGFKFSFHLETHFQTTAVTSRGGTSNSSTMTIMTMTFSGLGNIGVLSLRVVAAVLGGLASEVKVAPEHRTGSGL